MSKINLLTHQYDLTSFNAYWNKSIFEEYFNIIEYDGTGDYSPADSLIVSGMGGQPREWYKELAGRGIKIVINHLGERASSASYMTPPPNSYVLLNDNGYWYNEALWYMQLGYHNYVPNKTYTHTAFMPMRLFKDYRDVWLKMVEPFLNRMIYSYVDRGIYLPDDLPNDLAQPGGPFQRYFNPSWYDSTYFSIPVESQIDNRSTVFPTEKSYKPCAYRHPFLSMSQSGTLAILRGNGFETFENLFNESYDLIDDEHERMLALVENIKNFECKPYDQLTLDKLDHNHNLFFNRDHIKQRVTNEIIHPMIEFLNAK